LQRTEVSCFLKNGIIASFLSSSISKREKKKMSFVCSRSFLFVWFIFFYREIIREDVCFSTGHKNKRVLSILFHQKSSFITKNRRIPALLRFFSHLFFRWFPSSEIFIFFEKRETAGVASALHDMLTRSGPCCPSSSCRSAGTSCSASARSARPSCTSCTAA